MAQQWKKICEIEVSGSVAAPGDGDKVKVEYVHAGGYRGWIETCAVSAHDSAADVAYYVFNLVRGASGIKIEAMGSTQVTIKVDMQGAWANMERIDIAHCPAGLSFHVNNLLYQAAPPAAPPSAASLSAPYSVAALFDDCPKSAEAAPAPIANYCGNCSRYGFLSQGCDLEHGVKDQNHQCHLDNFKPATKTEGLL